MTKNYFENETEFEKRYPELYAWFGCCAVEADGDEFDDDVIIDKYFRSHYIKGEKQTVAEAEEVLKLDPFPEQLIENMRYCYSPICTQKEMLEEFKDKLQAKIDEAEGKIKPKNLESEKTVSKDNKELKLPGFDINSD